MRNNDLVPIVLSGSTSADTKIAMQVASRLTAFRARMREAAAPPWVRRSALWRGGLLALCIVFAFSTQLLFQFDLYASWALPDIFLGWVDHLADQLTVGTCIFTAVAAASVLPARTTGSTHLLILASIAAGAVTGEVLLMLRVPPPHGLSVDAVLFAKSARWFAISALAYAFFVFQREAAEAAAKLHASELQRIQSELQMTQAQLQSLRAYIEPHFLFNTLANVRQLYRTEPDRGRAMLANFIAYVRAVLPQMRDGHTTLRQDVDLARAYLAVLQVRMGARLQVHFDVPDDLAVLPFPPLALSTLTENAIKHGLNPLPEGGAIEISARRAGEKLRVSVADTGAGLRSASGSGSGLANLRARLTALYDSAASLELEANVPRGIKATITVPVSGAGAAA